MARVFFCLLVFSLSSILVRGQDPHSRCPPPTDIEPCLCRRSCEDCDPVIECSGFKSVDELKEVVTKSGDYPFTIFTVSNADINYVPTSSLESKQIKFLSIVNSSLVSIFDGLPPDSSVLSSIYLYNIKLQHGVRWELLYQLHALNVLTVSRVDVPKIEDSFGSIMPKHVKVLHFSRTSTTELGKNAFAPLRNLNSLVLRNSQVKVIERTMFPKPYRGTLLDFSYNKIQQLPEDFFSDMPSLKSLILNNNNIATLSEKVFSSVGKTVSYVPLRDNPIKCDCRMKWITGKTRLPYFDARCFSPDALQGRNVRELKAEDFGHC